MSFISVLHKIEEDVTIGINAALPIVGTFSPGIALVLSAIAKGLQVLEEKKVDAANVRPLVQAIATNCTIMQHQKLCTWTPSCTACINPYCGSKS